MSKRTDSEARKWTEEELGKRFGWWWRRAGSALRKALPTLSDEGREYHFRKVLNRCAFNYELSARRGMKRGRRPNYEFRKPFHRLSPEQMSVLHLRWRGKTAAPCFEFLAYAARPSATAALAALEGESTVDCGTAAMLRSHDVRAKRVERIIKAHTKTGWTVPQYFSVNLGGHSDGTICVAFRKWLKSQRDSLGIPAPKHGKGRSLRSSKSGTSFREIEALDVWTHLPTAEARKTGYDDAAKRRAKRRAETIFSGQGAEV